MKILVTGSQGFIGKNLITELNANNDFKVLEVDRDTTAETLNEYCQKADFVVHLAGVNRPQNPEEFKEGNSDFTTTLIGVLKKNQNHCPVLLSSSIQASSNNPYGDSKRSAEDTLFAYGKETNAKVLVYRFPNVFGKWSRPNYNSAIATFCYNIARELPIQVNDPKHVLTMVYIDDVVAEIMKAIEGNETRNGEYCEVPVTHTKSLQEIVDLIYSFKTSRENRMIPDMADEFSKKLYSTYLSFLPPDQFNYPLKMNIDYRGSFTEFIKSPERGQVSVNVSKPGTVKGNHWHHTKNEKFLVVSGEGVIRFRGVDSDEVIEYFVRGDKLEVVDIPPGYTHNIENFGDSDLVTIMWANELYNPEKPDTYFLEV